MADTTICEGCNGIGEVMISKSEKGDYDLCVCPFCLGSGQLVNGKANISRLRRSKKSLEHALDVAVKAFNKPKEKKR